MTLDRQPTLEGERLLLRPLRPDDWDALFAVAADPLIWADHPEPDRWREPVFAAYFAGLMERGGALAVIDKGAPGGPVLIGTSRFQWGSSDDGGTIEIGSTVLARSHWGTGTNSEMKRLMVAHALNEVEQVEFWAGADNQRSRRALEKIGARLVDRIEPVEVAGRKVPHVVYAITRADFAAERLAGGAR